MQLFYRWARPSHKQRDTNFPVRPGALDPERGTPTKDQAAGVANRRANLDRAQKEAEDLARTAQSIPADVGKIREGMLPKDVIEKPKQMEKLSKHLRGELNP